MDDVSIGNINAEREKTWERRKPLAELFNMRPEDYDLSGVVKKITNYKPVNNNGVPSIEKETTFLKRPFKHDRPLSSSERSQLPLPITSCCKWVGLTDFPVGTWMQNFRQPYGWFDGLSDSKHLNPLLKGKEERLLSRYTLVSGSWQTNKSLLVDMGKPPANKDNASVYELLDYSIDRIDKFGLPVISSKLPKWWLRAVTMNPDANPGVLTKRLFGANKRAAYGKAIIVASRIWDKIVTSRSAICDNSLWSVGGRARKQDMAKGKPPESRIILMPETPNSIIASVIAQPIIKEMKKVSTANPDVECFMGHDVTLGGWSRIKEFTKEGTPTLELDWEKFDSTITENVIVASFCLLRTVFPESRKIDKLFLFVMSGFVYKNIAIKQRFIYRITRGVPSGSPLTSLIVTLSNWVCLNYVLRKQKLFGIESGEDYKLAVAGDDTLIAFVNNNTFKLEDAKHVSDTFRKEANLKVEPDDLNFNEWMGGELYNLDDIEYSPSLLKTMIWQGLPGRRLDDLVKSISCPESKMISYWSVLATLRGYTSLPIMTPLGRALLTSLGAFVSEKCRLQDGESDFDDVYNPFSPNTYLPKFESIVVSPCVSDKMNRDPPYLTKDKWNGLPDTGWKAVLIFKIDLDLFGVSE
uniref:RdRp n=1 Tax=viral metagenome TaxID=1070528 RepID=A0A2V0RJP3_9ZZZZ